MSTITYLKLLGPGVFWDSEFFPLQKGIMKADSLYYIMPQWGLEQYVHDMKCLTLRSESIS